MAGHSKWAQIKRKKQAKDQKKGKIFSKLAREITLAVVAGGGSDPSTNVRLRMAIEKAKQLRMPKENIQRAISRGVGEGKESLKELFYEAFAPFGVGLIIQVMTDNNNRSLNAVRLVLEKEGGKLAVKGAVEHLFKRCASVSLEKNKVGEDKVFDFAEKVSAFDIEEDSEYYFVYFPFENIGEAKNFLEELGLVDFTPELDYRPVSFIKIEEKTKAERLLSLIEKLENLDDVQKVFANFDIPEEIMPSNL